MRDPENIGNVAALKPDYMGFIFYAKSPRYVSDVFAPSIFPAARVGVFVNEEAAVITQRAREHQLEYVQLHGDESPEVCRQVRTAGLKIIKVFRVDQSFDFNQSMEFESEADFFLFDTKGEKFGGNAATFDWKVLEKYNQRIPFFISGGLHPANIRDLGNVLQMNVHALDLNSGVEDSPGLKNIDKVKEAISNLNKINYHGIPGR